MYSIYRHLLLSVPDPVRSTGLIFPAGIDKAHMFLDPESAGTLGDHTPGPQAWYMMLR